MTHGLFKTVLFNFQVFEDFTIIFLLLISSLIPLWSDNTLCMISIIFFKEFIYRKKAYVQARGQAKEEGKRESQVDSALSMEPNVGLKSRVGYLTN